MHIKDSIENALNGRRAHFDSTYKPLTEMEKKTASIAATVAMNLLLMPIGGMGVCIIENKHGPTYSYQEEKALIAATSRPRLIGSAKLIRLKSKEIVWKKKIEMQDEYDSLWIA